MFPRLLTRATFVAHKFCVRDPKIVSDFVQKHFVSATNVSQFAQPKKHHEQQYVRNNVSSFASTFSAETLLKLHIVGTAHSSEYMHSFLINE